MNSIIKMKTEKVQVQVFMISVRVLLLLYGLIFPVRLHYKITFQTLISKEYSLKNTIIILTWKNSVPDLGAGANPTAGATVP